MKQHTLAMPSIGNKNGSTASIMRGSNLNAPFARLQGMKLRARSARPRPATGGFPYPARTCAEWTALEAKLSRRDV